MGIVGFYGGIKLAFSVFATSFVAGLIWAFGIKKVIHIEVEPFTSSLILNNESMRLSIPFLVRGFIGTTLV